LKYCQQFFATADNDYNKLFVLKHNFKAPVHSPSVISDCDVRSKKCNKILANYIQIEIFFNETIFAIDKTDIKYSENYLFVSERK